MIESTAYLQNFQQSLKIVNEDCHIEFKTINDLHKRFSQFLSEYEKLQPDHITLLSGCCILYINCLQKYMDHNLFLDKKCANIVKQFLAIISHIAKLPDIGNNFCTDVTIECLKIITSSIMQQWFATELMKNVNLVLENTSPTIRWDIAQVNNIYLCKLAEIIYNNGDYTFQLTLLTTIIHMFSETQLVEDAGKLFPFSFELQRALCNIDPQKFDEHARIFLNMVNSETKKVLSIKCARVLLGYTEILPPIWSKNSESILWVDFNTTSETITILCDHSSLQTPISSNKQDDEKQFESIMIDVADINYVLMSRYLIESSSQGIGYTFLFKMSALCSILHDSSREATNSLDFKIVIYDSPELTSLIRTVLPNWFGEKFINLQPLSKLQFVGTAETESKKRITVAALPRQSVLNSELVSVKGDTVLKQSIDTPVYLGCYTCDDLTTSECTTTESNILDLSFNPPSIEPSKAADVNFTSVLKSIEDRVSKDRVYTSYELKNTLTKSEDDDCSDINEITPKRRLLKVKSTRHKLPFTSSPVSLKSAITNQLKNNTKNQDDSIHKTTSKKHLLTVKSTRKKIPSISSSSSKSDTSNQLMDNGAKNQEDDIGDIHKTTPKKQLSTAIYITGNISSSQSTISPTSDAMSLKDRLHKHKHEKFIQYENQRISKSPKIKNLKQLRKAANNPELLRIAKEQTDSRCNLTSTSTWEKTLVENAQSFTRICVGDKPEPNDSESSSVFYNIPVKQRKNGRKNKINKSVHADKTKSNKIKSHSLKCHSTRFQSQKYLKRDTIKSQNLKNVDSKISDVVHNQHQIGKIPYLPNETVPQLPDNAPISEYSEIRILQNQLIAATHYPSTVDVLIPEQFSNCKESILLENQHTASQNSLNACHLLMAENNNGKTSTLLSEKINYNIETQTNTDLLNPCQDVSQIQKTAKMFGNITNELQIELDTNLSTNKEEMKKPVYENSMQRLIQNYQPNKQIKLDIKSCSPKLEILSSDETVFYNFDGKKRKNGKENKINKSVSIYKKKSKKVKSLGLKRHCTKFQFQKDKIKSQNIKNHDSKIDDVHIQQQIGNIPYLLNETVPQLPVNVEMSEYSENGIVNTQCIEATHHPSTVDVLIAEQFPNCKESILLENQHIASQNSLNACHLLMAENNNGKTSTLLLEKKNYNIDLFDSFMDVLQTEPQIELDTNLSTNKEETKKPVDNSSEQRIIIQNDPPNKQIKSCKDISLKESTKHSFNNTSYNKFNTRENSKGPYVEPGKSEILSSNETGFYNFGVKKRKNGKEKINKALPVDKKKSNKVKLHSLKSHSTKFQFQKYLKKDEIKLQHIKNDDSKINAVPNQHQIEKIPYLPNETAPQLPVNVQISEHSENGTLKNQCISDTYRLSTVDVLISEQFPKCKESSRLKNQHIASQNSLNGCHLLMTENNNEKTSTLLLEKKNYNTDAYTNTDLLEPYQNALQIEKSTKIFDNITNELQVELGTNLSTNKEEPKKPFYENSEKRLIIDNDRPNKQLKSDIKLCNNKSIKETTKYSSNNTSYNTFNIKYNANGSDLVPGKSKIRKIQSPLHKQSANTTKYLKQKKQHIETNELRNKHSYAYAIKRVPPYLNSSQYKKNKTEFYSLLNSVSEAVIKQFNKDRTLRRSKKYKQMEKCQTRKKAPTSYSNYDSLITEQPQTKLVNNGKLFEQPAIQKENGGTANCLSNSTPSNNNLGVNGFQPFAVALPLHAPAPQISINYKGTTNRVDQAFIINVIENLVGKIDCLYILLLELQTLVIDDEHK